MQTDIAKTTKQPPAGTFRHKWVFAQGYVCGKSYCKSEWDFNAPRDSKANTIAYRSSPDILQYLRLG